MADEGRYLQTNAMGIAALDLVISLLYILVNKGIITEEEVKELIAEKAYRTNKLQALPLNPIEISPVEVKKVFNTILNAIERADKERDNNENDTEKIILPKEKI